MPQPTRITLEVARSDPARPSTFEVPVPTPASRVLDALLYAREHFDPSLGFRYACRAGMCGACAVVVNGKEVLACQAPVASLEADRVRVEPLRALPVLRDLVCDMEPFFDTFRRADAALRPADPDRATPRAMPPGESRRALIERQNGCLTCGACFSACASSAAQPVGLGPAALNRVLMLSLDERDAKGRERLASLAEEAGPLRRYAQNDCGAVCPVDIPLGEAMATLERMLAEADPLRSP